VPPEGTLGREFPEKPDPTRFAFQRDRDRILHATAFRRLQGKTQVFVAGESDHYRTRLTHTLEASQITRDLALTLSLNENLAECIVLSHDLGHPPFGHAGEEALDLWMKKHGSHFEHNEHSLRIVTRLEPHSFLFQGLNLNREVLEGIQKHERLKDRGHSLEAQIVNIADEIAYNSHDCDDGIRSGLIHMKELTDLKIVQKAADLRRARGTSLRGTLIRIMIEDLAKRTSELIEEKGFQSLEDVYNYRHPIAEFSPEMSEWVKELRTFLSAKMYWHPAVADANEDGQIIITVLCNHFYRHPIDKILDLEERHKESRLEAVRDYVAGMTDTFAREQARELGLIHF
jgi:dGTPase